MAVLTFNGTYTDEAAEAQKQTLRDLLKTHNIVLKGDWEVYVYNPPSMTIPSCKTNEVAIEVDMSD